MCHEVCVSYVLIPMNKAELKRPAAIDLFSGCGGLTAGLRNAGFDVIAAVENEPLACATYKLNHPNTLLLERDITSVKPTYLRNRLGLRVGELTLLAGCPPCQGFSALRTLNGAKQVNEPMNDLLFQFMKFARAFLPKAIIMENVPGLAKDDRIIDFRKRLTTLGYLSDVRVLDAADYGTPQRRKRMVLVALRGDTPKFALPSKYRKSVKWALSRLPSCEQSDDPLHNYEVTRAKHVEQLIRQIPKDGGSRTDLPDSSQLPCHVKCDGFKDIYGRMSWSEPAPTITGGCINPSKGRFLHPTEDRAITLREAALLQGFSKTYRFDFSKGRYPVAQLIGNAFPPKFAELQAKQVLQSIRK